jgi:hypothetical protein
VVVLDEENESLSFVDVCIPSLRLCLLAVPALGDEGDAMGERAQGDRGAPPSCCAGESRWRRYESGEGVVGEHGGVTSGDDDADSGSGKWRIGGESDCVASSSSK